MGNEKKQINMKTNFKPASCCNFCKHYILDGNNGYCNEDDSYKDIKVTDPEQVLWEWAVIHASKKMNICDDFVQW
jgi:hypothetical protein